MTRLTCHASLSRMQSELTYYTTTEVAQRAHVDASTVRIWVAKGKLPAISTLGGHHRFERSVIDELFPASTAERAS